MWWRDCPRRGRGWSEKGEEGCCMIDGVGRKSGRMRAWLVAQVNNEF